MVVQVIFTTSFLVFLLRETRFIFDVMPFNILFSSNLVLEFKNELLQALLAFFQYHYLDCVQHNNNLQWTYYEHQIEQSEINISSSAIIGWNNQ